MSTQISVFVKYGYKSHLFFLCTQNELNVRRPLHFVYLFHLVENDLFRLRPVEEIIDETQIS